MGRWYPAVVALLATSLVVSNIIAVRLIAFSLFDLIELTLPAAIVLFPVAYIVGDVLTEVYGYPAARRGIWIAFGCNLRALYQVVSTRTCWLLQSAYWKPLLKSMEAQLRTVDPELGQLFRKPCERTGVCLSPVEIQRRLDGKDPNPPCPIYVRLGLSQGPS